MLVSLLALAGYAFVVGLLALVTLGSIVLVVLVVGGTPSHPLLRLGVPLAVVAYLLARAAAVRVPEPQGLPLVPAASPRLFALLEEVRAAVGGARVHRVVLTDDFNAGVAQVPRFGLLGGARNHLVVGLPLFLALSTDQVRAVLAHELGHLASARRRPGGRAYRLRATWLRLLEALEASRGPSALVLTRFFSWYAPYFAAYSFVLARTLEDEADRTMAAVTGADAAAEALVSLALADDYLDHTFWPRFMKRALREPEPPAPFTTMAEDLAAREETAPGAADRLQRLLARPRDPDDTHPSLAERLSHLGVSPRIPGPPPVSAARDLLGGALPVLVSALDQMWQAQELEIWEGRHREARDAESGLARLEREAAVRELTLDEARDRAAWTEDVISPEAALPLYREIVARDPTLADCRYALGRLLLGVADPTGISHLEHAAALDARLGPDAYDLILAYLLEAGRQTDLEHYRRLRDGAVALLVRLLQERRDVTRHDTFLPHGLAPEALDRLRGPLADEPLVDRAYLVRKATTAFPDMPLHVLGLALTEGWYRFGAGRRRREMLQRLVKTVDLPAGAFFVILDAPGGEGLRRAIAAVPGAVVYSRGEGV